MVMMKNKDLVYRRAKKRQVAKVYPIRVNLETLIKKYHKNQKTLSKRGLSWFKKIQAKKRRSLERQMEYLILNGDDRWERIPPDIRKSIYWEIW
ncbi:hypothetical protein P74p63 [Thermus phage P74-26]|uniref:Uncharacterized protein n=1 Tax=Thermus phage P74-26 TaxID=2914007 RepID=A7XXN7_BP742|nr:hypothetical protein P74p63 [Thermus phage P74-26]ABU97013.1 hypothetical protein P74p63 [Thermus phage P74-26]